ncbi:LysR family transcriptional regulator [Thiocystis violacea]|uniref:LysR family transcriptional regulator n=1 Tax=Thiocystis violacea TaxID=13725 RepID=UPI00190465D7|nr:LysR family transcriptional regulator [Thiocystis violacea]MBK1724568.1 LysR family transcriptional regulator [Thiocystis violacea]
MDSRHLKCFLHVLEAGGLSRASQRMHLTQSALSRQIRQLEEHLGVDLFSRTGRGLVPTEAGRRLEPRARALITDLDRLETELTAGAGRIVGSLVMAVPPSLGSARPASLICDYRTLYPLVRIRMISAMSGAIQDGLLQGRFDLGLLHHPRTAAGLISENLWRERLWLVADAEAGLSAERPVPYAAALREPMILPNPRHGLRALVQGYAAGMGIGLEVALEVDSLPIILELVALGIGRTLLPHPAIEAELATGRLSAAPVVAPEMERVTVLAWAEDRSPNRAAAAMADLIRERWRQPV